MLNTPAHLKAFQLLVDMINKDKSTVPPISDNPIWKPLLPTITTGNGNPRPMLERYTALVETNVTPLWMKAFMGQMAARDALDESTRAATAFWQGIGGNATKAL